MVGKDPEFRRMDELKGAMWEATITLSSGWWFWKKEQRVSYVSEDGEIWFDNTIPPTRAATYSELFLREQFIAWKLRKGVELKLRLAKARASRGG
jgi:hypothetical protein